MNAAHQRRLTPALGALVVVLGVLLLLLLGGLGRGVHWAPPRPLPPLPPAGNGAGLPQPKPLQQFAMVWQQPLFNPDRKPLARAAASNSNLGDLELTGIIITPQLRMAMLRDRKGDKEIRLREGATLPDGSVTLIEVHPRSAVFDAPAGRTELKLPAGAPIDQPRDRPADEPGAPAAGAASMRVQQGRAAQAAFPIRPVPGQGQAATPADARSRAALEQLRQTVQKRRAERAAASHEGEH